MQTPDVPDVEVHRFFPVPRELVFDAWTRPDSIRRWNTRPGVTAAVAEVDLRVGGRYRLDLNGPDGKLHRVEGVYRLVEPPARLVYTWRASNDPEPHESIVRVEFRECTGGTEVTLRHERAPTLDSRRRHASGWRACLERLEQILTENACTTEQTRPSQM